MIEGGTGHLVKAYLVADMDFTGPLPVVRQFSIFSRNPYHEPGLGPNRTWAVLMVRESGSFAKAMEEILHDLPERHPLRIHEQVLRLMDEVSDEEAHALKYRLPQALDAFVASMPVPDHPFFEKFTELFVDETILARSAEPRLSGSRVGRR
jgi:hypothetical protein